MVRVSPWNDIERIGFYPDILRRTLTRVLGRIEPAVVIHQLDAGFDRGSMFRHLTLLALSEPAPAGGRLLVHIHVDELEDGGAAVSTALHPADRVRAVSLTEVVPTPQSAEAQPDEVTVSLNLGATRRAEIEPARCDDPSCPADHGFTATSFPEDVVIRVSEAADGALALERIQTFVDLLCADIAGRRHG